MKAIVLAWCDKTGMRDTGRVEKRDCNWFPIFEPCWKPSAVVFSRDMNEKQRAVDFAATLEAPIVRVLILDDTDTILTQGRRIIMELAGFL